jgi:hypothetical protein
MKRYFLLFKIFPVLHPMFFFLISLSSSCSGDFLYADEKCTIVEKCISKEQSIGVPSSVVEIKTFAFSDSSPNSVTFEAGSSLKKLGAMLFHVQI